MSKKTNTAKIESAVAKGVSYEVTIADRARRSERRAWFVALSSLVMSLILAGGYFYMLPLKEKVPYMVMADPYSGTATVAKLTDDFAQQRITASEAINRSNVANYLMARESYDNAMLNLRDWSTVFTMSTPAVVNDYRALYSSANPNSPFKIYGKNQAVRVKILSITFIGGNAAQGIPPKGATVRFQRRVYDKTSGASKPLDSKIATLAFSYNKNLQMDEQKRIINPLGFQVTEYRVDNDFATSPVAEVQFPAASAPYDPAAQQQGGPMNEYAPPPGEVADPAQISQPVPTSSVDGASTR